MSALLLVLIFGGLAWGGLRGPWPHAAAAAVLWAAAARGAPGLGAITAGPLWAAWLAWTFLSAVCSGEPLRGLAAASQTATAALVYVLAARNLDARAKRAWFICLCAAGVVTGLAAHVITQPGRAMTGLLFPHYNHTAAVQAAVFAACAAVLAGEAPSRRSRIVLTAVMAFSLVNIAAAGSRGAFLAAAAAGALVLLRGRRWRTLSAAALLATAGFALMPSTALTSALKLSHRGAFMRPAIWKASIDGAREHPVLGQGPGQFERAFLRHNFPAPEGHRPTRYGLSSGHAHSEPLQIAVETGFPGAALFLLAVLWTLGAAWRGTDWTGEAALAASAAFLIQGIYDNNLALPAVRWLFFSALAVAAHSAADESAGGSPGRFGLSRAACALGLALSSLAWWPDWAVADRRRRAFETAGPESVEELSRALDIAGGDASLWVDFARIHMRLSPPDKRGALKALGEAAVRHPTNAVVPLAAAGILRAEQRWAAVLALADEARSLEPRSPEARMLRAEALLRLGRTEAARGEFSSLDPHSRPEEDPDAGRGDERLILHFDSEKYEELRRELEE